MRKKNMTVTCNEPTEHFSNGCALLQFFDQHSDGVISSDDANLANALYTRRQINIDEFAFVLTVSGSVTNGVINAACPGCFGSTQPPSPHLPPPLCPKGTFYIIAYNDGCVDGYTKKYSEITHLWYCSCNNDPEEPIDSTLPPSQHPPSPNLPGDLSENMIPIIIIGGGAILGMILLGGKKKR